MATKRRTKSKPRGGAAARPNAGRGSAGTPGADTLRVRMYNVLFGDAILVSIFEGGEARHILIDVGNVTGFGGDGDVFQPVVDDVLHELGDKPLDLYVMTHEHMDHVKGLLYANDRLGVDLKGKLRVRQAWLTASAKEDYYDHHADAKKKRLEFEQSIRSVTRFLIARHLDGNGAAGSTPEDLVRLLEGRAEVSVAERRVAALLLNNDFQSTGKCVDFLRRLADPRDTFYVARGVPPKRAPDLLSASVEIWGPEEDTAVYYGRLRPLMFGLPEEGKAPEDTPALPRLAPPSGVDAGAFFDLVEARRNGYGENLLAIDKAANNTSVVFCLEWNGWRLLFPGDAEEKSWAIMDSQGLLERPIDFLKIGHHGSHNGTPSADLLDKILPKDGRTRYAAVCTCKGVYGDTRETEVPNEKTLGDLARRSRVFSVEGLPKGEHVDLTFPANCKKAVVVEPESAAVAAPERARSSVSRPQSRSR